METYKLEKDKIAQFLQKLGEEFAIYAPVETDGIVAFEEFDETKALALEYARTHKPPKEIFFPHTEIMLRYDKDGMRSAEYNGKPIAVFAVRPCDAKSFLLIERIFVDIKYEDTYWAVRRNNSLIFTLACNEPLPTCFCNWLSGGPFNRTGSDVLVIDTGNMLILEPVSEKGKNALSNLDMLKKATKADIDKARSIAKNAESAMSASPKLDSLKTAIDSLWNDSIWDKISSKCLGCAACTFSCPTCYCFDIQDESRRGKGVRIRLWDTCQFPLFTKEGSGHNPRPAQKDRIRQRFMHKFSYFIEKQNESGCVGCGRCIAFCPVNMDVRKLIGDVLNIAQGTGGAK